MLLAVEYNEGMWVRLTFDRAVNAAGLVGGQIIVNDDGGEADSRMNGAGPVVMIGPAVVQIGLVNIGPPTGPSPVLIAGPGNGITAANDGGTWPGVTNLPLPFP